MPNVLKRGGRKRTAPLRVLLVDNDAATRMLCSVNLGLLGLEVLEAEEGAELIARTLDPSRAEAVGV